MEPPFSQRRCSRLRSVTSHARRRSDADSEVAHHAHVVVFEDVAVIQIETRMFREGRKAAVTPDDDKRRLMAPGELVDACVEPFSSRTGRCAAALLRE